MRGDTQATHLERMMCTHPLFQSYELTLYPVAVKRSSLKKIAKGDILLLGLESMEFLVWQESTIVATGHLLYCERSISIDSSVLPVNMTKLYENKKYEIVKCSFGQIYSKKLTKHRKLDVSPLDLARVTLKSDSKNIAHGRLVNINGQISVEIIKVEKK